MPRVSVILPAYNAEAYVGAAIESVLAGTYGDIEIIAVDDGSTDGTAAVIANYPEVKLIRRQNGGISAARNCALREAAGEFIAFIDADDLWKEDKLQIEVEYLDAHPETEIVYTNFANFTDMDEASMTERQKELLAVEDEHHLTTALARRGLFEKIGNFDTALAYSEDTEWDLRLRFLGRECVAKLENVTYLRRVHEKNITLSHEETGPKEMVILGARAAMKMRRIRGKQ